MSQEDILEKELFDIIGDDDKPQPPKPSEPEWLKYPAVANYGKDDTFYSDVINHTKRRERFDSLLTDAHETTHFVNSDIRNQHGNGVTISGFYVGQDRAIAMDQPKFRKSVVGQYVPRNLRESRYNLYVAGMREWDDSPLYLYDEWVAYTNGGQTGVDLVEKGKYRGSWTDGVMGALEFSIYATAVVAAVEKHDPSYLTRTPQFLKFTAWNLRRCKDVFDRGKVMAEFKWDRQDKLEENLRTSSEAAPLRDVLDRLLDSVWVK